MFIATLAVTALFALPQDAAPTAPAATAPKQAAPAAAAAPSRLSIGDPAPKLQYDEWIKGDKIDGIEKGKVHVIEFWATWCGPCIASFPKLTALRAAYPTNKVEFIGVTSPQGYVAHQKRARVDCKGDVAKEQSETVQFMKDMGMTWTVAMSGKDVFNPDFGIRGIPFVAVLDKEGKVFKAGLHPGDEDAIRAAVDECLAKK